MNGSHPFNAESREERYLRYKRVRDKQERRDRIILRVAVGVLLALVTSVLWK